MTEKKTFFKYDNFIHCYFIWLLKESRMLSWLQKLRAVNTTREEFEYSSLFLWLGLPSTLIRHQNGHDGAFRKRFLKRRK